MYASATIQTQLQSGVYFCYKNNNMSDSDTQKERPMYPSVTAAFSGYEPPSNVVVMAQRIVDSVPEKYLQGLTEIVLTNAGALSRNRRRSVSKSRGRKVRIKEARGLYHPASQQRGAWIEIFVDNTLNRWEGGWLQRTNWFREVELSGVLFHEIGHHIHFTTRPEYREKEDVADAWKVRLERNYIRQRYGWLRPLIRFFHVGGLVRRWNAKVSAEMVTKGHISRAEHEEAVRGRKQDIAGE
jgi:hypothetical protein